MKKAGLLILLLIIGTSAFSQDSIFNYLDKKGKVVKKKENAVAMETIVKKDSLWQVRKFYRNGKLQKQGYFRFKDKKKPVGEFTTFYRSGKARMTSYYNHLGEHDGLYKYWFEKGSVSNYGNYKKDKKIGIWKYYHYNGNNACRQYFKDGELLKTTVYSENGNAIEVNLIKWVKPKFKGGVKKFQEKLKGLSVYFKEYKLKGKIYVYFIIDIDGNITQVEIDDIIPEGLKKEIKLFLEKMKGWEPAIHMNRKVPSNYSLPLSFS